MVTEVVVDAARLEQVLYNYLSNALKFTPEGGHVLHEEASIRFYEKQVLPRLEKVKTAA